MRDTNEIVYNSANKEFNIESRINRKRKIIEDILGVDNIPKLDSYEIIIKNIFDKRKKERYLNNKNKLFNLKKEEEIILSNKENKKVEKGFISLNDIEKKLEAHMMKKELNKKFLK